MPLCIDLRANVHDQHRSKRFRNAGLSTTLTICTTKFPNLNTLCLRLIPIDAALKILECCRELVELSLSFLTEPHIRDLNDVSMQCWHREPLFFRQLESFEWYRVRMPALRTLALRDAPAPEDPASASERLFLIRHAMTVSTLHLEEVSRIFPEWTYINLFTSDSAIESLTIHKFDAAAIAGLIVLLTPESSGQARKSSVLLRRA
ncbi:hypothetical protein D9756_011585 [Leucocoprinus leucothites]|uniref:F-box domain-containing protein n=1 Tax=Leucocoprinus leucothites TaxID=201217 RepID=A0A8H5CL18_9AGAR|nr:hypothetical protein D9756_011585 [Leucoagaricus leucothites]